MTEKDIIRIIETKKKSLDQLNVPYKKIQELLKYPEINRVNNMYKKSKSKTGCSMFGCSARRRGGYKQGRKKKNKTQRRMKKRRLTKRRLTKRRLTKRLKTKRRTSR